MSAQQRPFTLKRSLLALLLAFPAHQALALTCTWNPATGNWGTAANWSCGNVPGAADVASIGGGQSSTVSGGQGPTNLSNAGTVTVSDNSSLTLLGTNVNSGTVNLQSFGNPTDLRVSGAVALNGAGVVSLSNVANNRLLAAAGAGDILTIGSGQTVQGAGQIGAGGALGLVNEGTVVANLSNGITVNAQGGVTNNHVLRGNGATLSIQNTTVTQGASGVLDAINNGVVQLSGASVTGGSFTTTAGSAINTTSGTTSTVSGVANFGTLNIVDNSTLALVGTLTNNGSVNMKSLGNPTSISVTGTQTINGSGTINLSNTLANRILGDGATLTLGSGQTLQGSGTLGAGSAGFALVNNGILIATQSQQLLINALGGVTNTGTLRADGGTLQLQTTVNSGGGAIEARNGSQVEFLNGAVINNANFSASGAGSLLTTVSGSTVTLGGGTVAGPMTIHDNSSLVLTGDVTYNGTLSLASVGNPTSLQFDGARSLSGTATVQMSNTSANRVSGRNASGDSLVVGNGITMQGAGIIGGNNLSLVNNGNLIATQPAGITLASGGTVTNNNVIRGDGATFAISGTNLSQGAAGVLDAVNNGIVRLIGNSTITGGTFTTGSGGQIATLSGHTAGISGVTNTGTLNIVDNSTLLLNGTLTNNGVVNMQSVGNPTDLRTTGNRLIDGTGTINLSNTLQNRIVAAAAGDSLTLGSGQTLQGAGQIGVGGQLNFTNNGTVIGNLPNAIVISSTGTVTNNNIVRADDGTVTISGTNFGQGALGVLDAVNNGIVRLIGNSTVSGGTFTTASGGRIATLSGNIAGVSGVRNTGTLNIVDNSALLLDGTLTNDGVINMQSLGNPTDLRTTGNRLIDGTGTINLSNVSTNRIIAATAGDRLTLGSGQTLQGAGQIGAGGQLDFTNNGTLIGNQSNALTISSSGTVINNNIVRADDGTVNVSGTDLGQGALGVIEAINGGTVNLNANATVTGGTFTTASGGQIRTTSAHVATIANVTNNGTFNVVDNSALVLSATVTNNGALNLNSLGNPTALRVAGNVTLGGTGITTLGNVATNRIVAAGAGDQLTNGAGHTIQGSGSFGAGSTMNIVNQGTITANQANALTIQVDGAHTVNNQVGGLLQATGGRTLNLNNAIANNGTIAANSGVVNANFGFTGTGTASTSGTGQLNVAAASTVGTLINNGGNATALSLGANNITVSGDYTNANWGDGNTFNRRANVSGTGQILAGGDVVQKVTGSNVTGGDTANATLTINNVRVGANDFAYQIANSGNSGPALRGAVQTQVNGAQLNDGRLSGTGVTPGNYNAGGPGSNSGDRTVTFTVASAGTLAPLTGQVLNLRSNFDNLADQKLNIALGAGAAAYNAATGNATPAPVQLANQRINGNASAGLTVTNTAAAGAFSEDLNAAFGSSTGAASGSGSISGILAGASNAGAMTVAVDSSAAGARSGTVTLNYQTAGAVNGVSNGLGVASAGSQTITVQGNVYQAALGNLINTSLNFGTVQVGQNVSQALSISNVATGAAGFVEDLNASFGASSGLGAGQISGVGAINGLLAGGTNNSGMTVNVDTNSAGAINGQIAVNYFSAGAVNGVSNGLGVLAVGSQNFGVAGTIQAIGNVIDAANPVINTAPPINLGKVRIGTASPLAVVSVSNQATGNPQAALNASISGNAPITASGSFNLLAPGATDASSLHVGMNTSNAGAISGTATIALVSDASNVGNCAPNCQINLAPQNIAVQGEVYRLADPTLNTNSVNLVARRGDAAPTAAISVSNQSPDGFNEGLKAAIANAPAGFSGSGSIANLAAGGTDAGTLQVVLNTGTAGIFAGQAEVAFESTGAGTTDAADVSVGSRLVGLAGKVYAPAVAQLNTVALDFGIVRVGDVVAARDVSVSNSALAAGLNDTLAASVSGSGPFTANGSVAGLATGASNAPGSLLVGLNTGTAGVFSGTADVAFASQNPDMADLDLGTQGVAVSAQINHLANADFDQLAGLGILSQTESDYVLDFGTVSIGSLLSGILQLDNEISGPADLLSGGFSFTGPVDFAYSGWNSFAGLAAGEAIDGLMIDFNALTAGQYADEIIFAGLSSNASGPDLAQSRRLTILANVVDNGGGPVPEPGSLALLLVAAVAGAIARRRQAARDAE